MENLELLNPRVASHLAIDNLKSNTDIIINKISETEISLTSSIKNTLSTTVFELLINANECEFIFKSEGKGLYLEILNDFEDFDDYFTEDEEYGSTCARLLLNKYREVYSEEIDNGSDLQIDEDFKINFIDNFVNVVLSAVYFE